MEPSTKGRQFRVRLTSFHITSFPRIATQKCSSSKTCHQHRARDSTCELSILGIDIAKDLLLILVTCFLPTTAPQCCTYEFILKWWAVGRKLTAYQKREWTLPVRSNSLESAQSRFSFLSDESSNRPALALSGGLKLPSRADLKA